MLKRFCGIFNYGINTLGRFVALLHLQAHREYCSNLFGCFGRVQSFL